MWLIAMWWLLGLVLLIRCFNRDKVVQTKFVHIMRWHEYTAVAALLLMLLAVMPLLLPMVFFERLIFEGNRHLRRAYRLCSEKVRQISRMTKARILDWIFARTKTETRTELVAETHDNISQTYRTAAATTVTHTETTRVDSMNLPRRLNIAARFALVLTVTVAVGLFVARITSGLSLFELDASFMLSVPTAFMSMFVLVFGLTHTKVSAGAVFSFLFWGALGMLIGHASTSDWLLFAAFAFVSCVWGLLLAINNAARHIKISSAEFAYFAFWSTSCVFHAISDSSPMHGL